MKAKRVKGGPSWRPEEGRGSLRPWEPAQGSGRAVPWPREGGVDCAVLELRDGLLRDTNLRGNVLQALVEIKANMKV